MKMKYRYFGLLLCATVLALPAGCQKGLEEKTGGQETEQVSDLTVSIARTKTGLGTGDYVVWTDGDQVLIKGAPASATVMNVLPMGSDATVGALGGGNSLPAVATTGRKYCGFYPGLTYTAAGGGWDVTKKTFTFPETTSYSAGSPLYWNPMYAESDTKNLEFKNLCGMLEILVKGSRTVKNIELSTTTSGYYLSGTFKMNSTGLIVADDATASQKRILDCGTSGVNPTKAGKKFYIALPARGSSFNLTMKINTVESIAGGGEDYEKTVTISDLGVGVLRASTANDEAKSVQLYSGGLYWATTNIGARKPEEAGWFLPWGATKTGYNPVTGRVGTTITFENAPPASEASKYVTTNWTKTAGFGYCNTPYLETTSTDNFTAGYSKAVSKYVLTADKATYGKGGTFSDDKSRLEAVDDAATVNLGPEFRTPTQKEWQDLFANCYAQQEKRNGMWGVTVYKVRNDADKNLIKMSYAKSGNTCMEPLSNAWTTRTPSTTDYKSDGSTSDVFIFLPAPGYYNLLNYTNNNSIPTGFYWSAVIGGTDGATFNTAVTADSRNIGTIYFYCNGANNTFSVMNRNDRHFGWSVRGVRETL